MFEIIFGPMRSQHFSNFEQICFSKADLKIIKIISNTKQAKVQY